MPSSIKNNSTYRPVQPPTSQSRGEIETPTPPTPQPSPFQAEGAGAAGSASHVADPKDSKDSFAVAKESLLGAPQLKTPTPPRTQQAAGPSAPVQTQATGTVEGNLSPERAGKVMSYVTQQQGMLLGQVAQGLMSGKLAPEALGPMRERGLKLAQSTADASAKEQFSSNDTQELSMKLMDHLTQTTKMLPNAGGFSFSLFGKSKPSESQKALGQQMSKLSQDIAQGRAGNRELLEFFQTGMHGGAAPTAEPSGAAHVQHTQPSAGASSSATLQQMTDLLGSVGGGILKYAAGSFSVPTPPLLTSTLGQQNGALSNKIDEGLKNGKLSTDQGAALKADLQKLEHSLSGAAAQGQIPVSEVLNLLKQNMDTISHVKTAIEK